MKLSFGTKASMNASDYSEKPAGTPLLAQFLLFLLSIACMALPAVADEYSIQKFGSVDDSPGEPDEFIAAEFAGQLRRANPSTVQDGRFYLRQKFEDPFEDLVTYDFYEGKATANKGTLGKYSNPDVTYTQLIKAKFYLNDGASSDEDIEKAYFDGKFVYAEGSDPLYMMVNGKMVKMEASVERESFFDVSTQPSGADVVVNGTTKGQTPLKFSVVGNKPIVVSLRKKGFYTSIRVLRPMLGKVVQDGVLLITRKDLDNPVNSFKVKQLEYSRKKDQKGLLELRNSLQAKIAAYPAESKSAMEEIKSNYPPNPGQRSDEEAEDYKSRTEAWEKDRNAEISALESTAKTYLESLQALLKELDDGMEDVFFSLRYIHVPPSSIEAVAFAKTTATLQVNHSSPDLQFTWNGKVEMGSNTKATIESEKDRLQAVARVWNLSNDNGKYPALYEISFFLDQQLLPISGKGTFASPDATRSAAVMTKAASFQTKLNGMPMAQKNNFVANDQSQTKATLKSYPKKSIVVAAPVLTPVVAPVLPPTAPPDNVAMNEPEDEEEPVVAEEGTEDDEEEEDEEEDQEISDERDEAADEAAQDVVDRFGMADEYRKWGAYGLFATALGTGVVGVMQHMEYNKAKNAHDITKNMIDTFISELEITCLSYPDITNCKEILIQENRGTNDEGNPRYLALLEPILAQNKSAMDSYQGGRNLFLGLSGLTLTGGIVLYTW